MPLFNKINSGESKENQQISNKIDPHSLGDWFRNSLFISNEQKESVLRAFSDTSLPGADFLILALFSCAIATFGLIANSSSAIIGAMVIGPLMSRILSLSLAFITGRWKILWQALGSIVFGVAGVLIFSSALSLILYRLPTGANIAYTSEIIARKSPTVFDFLIALAGGSTAALAVSLKRFSATLPGVAIATALVPPLCAAGIGISFLDMSLISGAAFLFLLNLIGIFLASAITFAFLGFRRIKK